jgi:putative transposase
MGDINNQNFVSLPFGKFSKKLASKLAIYGIRFQKVEESYTSKCDHLANESMEHHDKYLGKRYPRGLFKSSTGIVLNSDVNGALGIMLKIGMGNSVKTKLSSGGINPPARIKLADIRSNSCKKLINMCY